MRERRVDRCIIVDLYLAMTLEDVDWMTVCRCAPFEDLSLEDFGGEIRLPVNPTKVGLAFYNLSVVRVGPLVISLTHIPAG